MPWEGRKLSPRRIARKVSGPIHGHGMHWGAADPSRLTTFCARPLALVLPLCGTMNATNEDADVTSRGDRDSAEATSGRAKLNAAKSTLRPPSRPLLARAPGYPALEPVHEQRFHPELAGWRRNVGSAVALDRAPPVTGPTTASTFSTSSPPSRTTDIVV